ncbi:MAG: thioesterase domain-containing protein [Bacteroidota bacterium]
MQLFMLPYAGGNRYSYNFIINTIKSHRIQPNVLELPGRGRRFNEPVILNIEEAIEDYVRQIKALRNGKEFIIYGHSMGANLGFYVSKKLEIAGDNPFVFIASGSPGPLPLDLFEANGSLSDMELKKKLQELGGTSDEILENPEVFQFFKKSIKADFAVLDDELSLINSIVPIDAPIIALMGTHEDKVEQITNWKHLTRSSFSCTTIRGNHFFIHHYPERIMKILIRKYQSLESDILSAISKS